MFVDPPGGLLYSLAAISHTSSLRGQSEAARPALGLTSIGFIYFRERTDGTIIDERDDHLPLAI